MLYVMLNVVLCYALCVMCYIKICYVVLCDVIMLCCYVVMLCVTTTSNLFFVYIVTGGKIITSSYKLFISLFYT